MSVNPEPESVLPTPALTAKAVATRERLLELAASLFIERGYEAVSLRDIAVEAGMTKGAIYGHFRSKGQLLVDVIRTRLAQGDDQFEIENLGSSKAIFDLFIHPDSRELRLLQVDAAAAARHDPDVAAGLQEINATRGAWIRDTFRDNENGDTITFVINALAAGIGVQEAQGRELPNPDEWRETVAAMFAAATRRTRKD